MTPAIVVIDGEHYPPVVRDAIAGLPYEVLGAWLAGGTEKLRGEPDYGVPLVEALQDAFTDAEVVVDLSDEPVLGPRERMRAGRCSRRLASGWGGPRLFIPERRLRHGAVAYYGTWAPSLRFEVADARIGENPFKMCA